MKAVAVCVLVLAVLVSAQDLQYEQAAYADTAAEQLPPEDVADMGQEFDESSFAEEEGFPNLNLKNIPLSDFQKAAQDSSTAVKSIKDAVNKWKNPGGTAMPPSSSSTSPASSRTSGSSSVRPPSPAPSKRPLKYHAIIRPAPKRPIRHVALPSKRPIRRPIRQVVLPGRRPVRGSGRPGRGSGRPGRGSGRPGRPGRWSGRPGRRPIRRPIRQTSFSSGPKFVDTLWHSERWIPKGSENNDPEMAKLNLALGAVKEDILSTNKQINEERRWVIAVSKIISSYNSKMKRVETHIIALRKEMKNLYRKKKQIENLKLQRALEAKLKEARAELATLTNSLKHVAVKQGQLNKSGRDLRQTIAGIQGQLAKLRGQQLKKKKKCKNPGKKYDRKKRRCVRRCKRGKKWSRGGKKCVSRCKKSKRWSASKKKCVKRRGKGKKKSKKSKKH